MKRFLCCALLLLLLVPSMAGAEVEKVTWGSAYWYKVTPGMYEVGVDLPPGTYDVREDGDEQPLLITFSEILGADGLPDLDFFYSYSVLLSTRKWSGGCHAVIHLPSFGYLRIQGKPCRLYPVADGY